MVVSSNLLTSLEFIRSSEAICLSRSITHLLIVLYSLQDNIESHQVSILMLDFHKLYYFNDCGNSGTRTHTLLKHQILSLAWLPITAYSQISGVRWTQTNNLISMNDALQSIELLRHSVRMFYEALNYQALQALTAQ